MEKQTARLYPVACFITGTTANGGGIWKHVLHGLPQGLLRRNLPVLTQVLHFLDFSITPQHLKERWRHPLNEIYNDRFGLNYQADLFLDSGGFTLMFDPDLDLSRYGISREQLAEGILELQIDLGARYVASLDYPIPPGLDPAEARQRMNATQENALRVARRLSTMPDSTRPKLFVPIHGPTPEAMERFVARLLERFHDESLTPLIEGLAIGSMVPLRQAHRVADIVRYVHHARQVMPRSMPLHVFGVTGTLMPFLMAEGANSFDTSAYVQNAKALKYLDPSTRQSSHLRELRAYPCDCIVCRDRHLGADKEVLDAVQRGRKSEVYAAVALHNLELDLQLLEEAKAAQASGRLEQYIENLAKHFRGPARLLNTIRRPEQHVLLPVPVRAITSHTPDDFDVKARTYHPEKKTICLILPCSQEKPYMSSQSFQFVWRHVITALGEGAASRVAVVFLSGLYGPVPIEYAHEEAVTTYDFLLHPRDTQGVSRVSQRLSGFLDDHAQDFESFVAYVTLPAYRKAVDNAASSFPSLQVVPAGGRKDRFAYYKPQNIAELVSVLRNASGSALAVERGGDEPCSADVSEAS